jgi:hypothetical protein
MKTIALSLAILASTAAFAAMSLDAGADQQPKKIMQLQVRSAADIGKAFGVAANDGGRQAVEISCHPASSSWCAGGFVTACDNAKGGLSSNDGGVTCSLPQHK